VRTMATHTGTESEYRTRSPANSTVKITTMTVLLPRIAGTRD
jgi:hypothetical protein